MVYRNERARFFPLLPSLDLERIREEEKNMAKCNSASKKIFFSFFPPHILQDFFSFSPQLHSMHGGCRTAVR